MDTRATSHLSSYTGNLHTSSLNRNFHSIIVINGLSIPVTHSGHVQIPNPYRPLHLRNVLVTPNIIKNLVSVRKFTTDNKCSIDFDPYDFTVRDYHTRQTLLHCDSSGDLYPLHVSASSFALLTNNHSLWHQRLGHPGDADFDILQMDKCATGSSSQLSGKCKWINVNAIAEWRSIQMLFCDLFLIVLFSYRLFLKK
ncbi:hypothetical protein Tco_1444565, partial [Tanacetum coccineum]